MENQIPVNNQPVMTQPIQDTLFSLSELTVKSNSSVSELKEQIKTARTMVKEAYEEHAPFTEQKLRVEGEREQMQVIRKELDARPEIASLLQKIKDLSGEVKDKELTVSDCALEYARMAGKDNIEKDGCTYDIVKTAKLVKRMQ